MSIAIMTRVWDKSVQKGSALLLTIALADNANHDGICYPGIDYLKKKIRMSERATERLIDQLEDAGEIYRKSGQGRGNRTQYAILTGLDKASIVSLLTKYADQFSLSKDDIEIRADDVITKRRQFDTLKSERKQRRSETSKSAKKVSKTSKKGVVTERKTPTTVIEPSSSNTNTDSNSDELESFAPSTSANATVPGARAEPKTDDVAEWLHSKAQPALQESIENPLTPSSAPPPIPQPPEGKTWIYRNDMTRHLVRSKSKNPGKTLCGQDVGSFGLMVLYPDKYVECKECAARCTPVKKKARGGWHDLTDAMHNAIPETIRPPGRPHYGKNSGPAYNLWMASITAQDVMEYVAWAYQHDKWFCCGGAGGTPVIMSMYDVLKNIKGWKTKGLNNGQTTSKHASQSAETRTVSGGDLKEQLRKYRGNGSAPRGEIGTAPPEIVGAIPKRNTRA